ncbi:MAG TPA: cell division protein ZipA C-terminal FtsZ-binding domain-containing protein [Methylotenera sp.]|nr:cell division protein ZipA C-terminal FtsZ-binding domain-containing protein [Methylotenera sp.]
MSDLQIGLIIIGVLIILAVLVVNWWQERKFHQQVDDSFSPLQNDALLDGLNDDESYQANPNLDKPNLDVSSRYYHNSYADAAEENQFSFKKPSSDVEFSFDVKSMEDVSADFILPPEKIAASNHLHELNEKSAQHYDIKAIFADAFSHTKEAASDRDEAQSSKKPAIFNQDKADFSPAKVVDRIEPKFEDTHLNSQNSNLDDAPAHVLEEAKPDEVDESLPPMLNSQVDLTALLYLADATSFSSLSSTLASLLEGYDKPVFVHVQQSNSASDVAKEQVWSSLKDAKPEQLVTRVACSLQMADRAGAVSRYMLNRFQLAVETAGLDMNAHVEWQSSGDALTAATALDSFCIDVDKTIGFHLVHGENGAFTGTKLRGLAEAQGFTLSTDGSFKYYNSGESSFVMFNREDNPFSAEMLRASVVKGVTFQFDIPHIKQCTQAFGQMVQVARQMEIGLNAVLVDDNNKVLGDMQIEKIRQQLKMIHATMLVRGIIPGSESALRLFS